MKKYIRADFLTPLVTALGMVIYGVEALRLSPPVVNGVVQESFFPIIISPAPSSSSDTAGDIHSKGIRCTERAHPPSNVCMAPFM